MRVEFHPGARADFDEGFDWYAARSEDAAYAFLSAVNDAVQRIVEAPDRYERIDSRHRRCLTRRFPYSIVYRTDRDRVLIVAVAHAAREPKFWSIR